MDFYTLVRRNVSLKDTVNKRFASHFVVQTCRSTLVQDSLYRNNESCNWDIDSFRF